MAANKQQRTKPRRPALVGISPSPADQRPAAETAVGNKPLLALLNLESQIRGCNNEHELVYLIANETRKLTRARQVFVIDSRSKRPKVGGISSLDTVDRNVPLVRWIERIVFNLRKQDGDESVKEFVLPAYCGHDEADTQTYPFPHMLWVPFRAGSDTIGGILLARENAWTEADVAVAKRLAEAYTFGLIFQRTGMRRRAVKNPRRWWAYLAAALVVAVQFVPVPLVVHAPVEVTPRNPFVITAPIDGIVGEIVIKPNSPVAAGAVVMRFEDTILRNAFELADEQLRVAETRLHRISQASFYDSDAKKELRLAIAERDLKQRERDYSEQLLTRATVRTPRSGLAVFADRNEWAGRPVRTGERIMSISDPQHYEFTIDLPVGDAVILQNDARVKLYMNSDPLDAVEARLHNIAYEASMSKANILSYRLTARAQETGDRQFRLGSRGTAQLFGSDVPLFYFLFRRPLSSLRTMLTF